MPTTLATIKLDLPGEPRGELFWENGSVRCRLPGGEVEEVASGKCARHDACETIAALYGERGVNPANRGATWGLQWTPRGAALYAAHKDAATFASEFPGETLDPVATDWDATAWEMTELPEGSDRNALWPIYDAALIEQTKRLAKAARAR